MGANLVPGGCTFRAWAPRAEPVYVTGSFNDWRRTDETCRLVRDGQGYWSGFLPGVVAGAQYKFFVNGPGSVGHKRDPYARELVTSDWNCVVSDPAAFQWHDHDFRAPAFEDMIIYQLHIGTFHAVDASGNDNRQNRVAKFLDLLGRVEYLADLGINAVQPLPVVEFPTAFSLGYNGVDYFAPELDYGVGAEALGPYLDTANALLEAKGYGHVSASQVTGADDQLRLLVDILHIYGIAVIFDVVYNHAGGDFGDQSLFFFDRVAFGNNNDSLYFTGEGWAGGLVFAYWNASVRQFLIDNAMAYLDSFHADGFRYDEVSVIDRFGGWKCCQDLTATVRHKKPSVVQIAEYWMPEQSFSVRPVAGGGAGFDLVWHAGLRDAVRAVIAAASSGADAALDLGHLCDALKIPAGLDAGWRAVQMLENHDLLLVDHSPQDRKPRVPALADPNNSRSWYARSRSRVATGLLLTAPGVPMIFMGQEFLEDKYWSDDPARNDCRIWWQGLSSDRAMGDHLRFTRELIALRRRLPALRKGSVRVFHCNNKARVLAFHRWIEGEGRDVVAVISLSETTHYHYRLGFPRGGPWKVEFNSDVYDHWVNPIVAGNGFEVTTDNTGVEDMTVSSEIVIPANSIQIFCIA